jgi:hypothetical protein
MKRGSTEHPKMKELAAALRLPLYAAVGIIETLYHWASKYALRGDVGKWTNEAIATGIGWSGDADELIAALVKTRWLDEVSPEFRLVIHDITDHADDVWRRCLENADLSFWNGEPPRKYNIQKKKTKVVRNSSKTRTKLVRNSDQSRKTETETETETETFPAAIRESRGVEAEPEPREIRRPSPNRIGTPTRAGEILPSPGAAAPEDLARIGAAMQTAIHWNLPPDDRIIRRVYAAGRGDVEGTCSRIDAIGKRRTRIESYGYFAEILECDLRTAMQATKKAASP